VVPLLAPALAALDELAPARAGEFLFTASQGAEPASYSGCAAAVREVCAAMAKAEELDAGKGSFTIGDLRRTVETRLAAAGVSVDVRAQLQSHGLGGVQSRFYDRHDWAAEKRAALEKLHELLTGTAATGRNRRARKGAK
jgi:integrase